jgi:hypothetical protein
VSAELLLRSNTNLSANFVFSVGNRKTKSQKVNLSGSSTDAISNTLSLWGDKWNFNGETSWKKIKILRPTRKSKDNIRMDLGKYIVKIRLG